MKIPGCRSLRQLARPLMAAAVRAGADPACFGYRHIERVPLGAYCEAHRGDPRVSCRRIHEPEVAANPLPRNILDRERLPKDRGWWGYSFWDVPERQSGPTLLATLPDCRIVPRIDEQGEFWITLLNEKKQALVIREMALRREHRQVLLQAEVDHWDQAIWALERVYHNYSHWLTAHLPKLLLIKQLGLKGPILLPARRPRFIDDSLRLMGFPESDFASFDPGRMLQVKRLTTLDTDRFRPDLLRLPREACPRLAEAPPWRRVFISREGAARRRLLNEAELWPLLEENGFERVRMEALSFAEQVKLMQETAVLCAPHGAGLTNLLFCPEGAQVIEMADLSFPNPNFYAAASAAGLGYWLVSAEGVGDVHPLEKDLRVDRGALAATLEAVVQQPLSRR